MNLPKRNSADGRCYWMKPEVQEELQPLFDQCIQDAIDGRITRLDSLWPPVVVSSEGAPFEVWQLLRTWTEAQRAETLDAEKAIAFSENLRRQSRWGEIDHHLLDMLQRELQEKYFIVTGNEDDHFWDREYSLKPGIRAEQVPEPLLRFACYVAVSYKVYGMDFQYLDANYLFGLVEKVRPDMVKKLKEHGTGRLPLNLQKRKTEHFTASANDAFAVIRITARNSTEECCHEVLNYLCELLEQEDFPRSYAVEFKGPEKMHRLLSVGAPQPLHTVAHFERGGVQYGLWYVARFEGLCPAVGRVGDDGLRPSCGCGCQRGGDDKEGEFCFHGFGVLVYGAILPRKTKGDG